MNQQLFRNINAPRLIPVRDGVARPCTLRTCLAALLLGCFAATVLQAEHRAALLIGNTVHADGTVLASPANDIRVVAAILRKHGFHSTLCDDLDREGMYDAIDRFIQAAPINGTALIYFSGYVRAVPDAERGKVRLLGVDHDAEGLAVIELADWLSLHSATAKNVIVLDGCPLSAKSVALQKLIDIKALPPNIWLTDAAWTEPSRPTGSESAFAGKLSTSAHANLGDKLTAACTWSASTCAEPPFSGRASRAVAPPNVFPLVAKPGDEWVAPDGTVFCYCPPREDGDGFWIGKYETPLCKWRIPGYYGGTGIHRNDPTTGHLSADVHKRLEALTASERNAGRLPADWEYALPSPEQWEHAARAGTQGERYFADAELVRHVNFADRSLLETEDDFYLYADANLNDGAAQLAPVGSYLPNAWGLHDVYGNVWELTDRGVLCGGGWTSLPGYCRAGVRKPPLQSPADYVGLRIVVRPARPDPARSERSLE